MFGCGLFVAAFVGVFPEEGNPFLNRNRLGYYGISGCRLLSLLGLHAVKLEVSSDGP